MANKCPPPPPPCLPSYFIMLRVSCIEKSLHLGGRISVHSLHTTGRETHGYQLRGDVGKVCDKVVHDITNVVVSYNILYGGGEE
jgi:hypothetical protein